MQKPTKKQMNNLLFGAAMHHIFSDKKKKNDNTINQGESNVANSESSLGKGLFFLIPVLIIAIIICDNTGHPFIAIGLLITLCISAIKLIPIFGYIAFIWFCHGIGWSGFAYFLIALPVILFVFMMIWFPED